MTTFNHTGQNLPYISIPELNSYFLIDTGSSKSFLNPNLAYHYYQPYIQSENFNVQTPHGISNHSQTAVIPLFNIFLYEHHFFDHLPYTFP